MQSRKPHLVAEVELDEVRQALSAWSWMLGDGWSPLLVSAAGDVFLVDAAGAVARLDTGVGTLEKVAGSLELFENALADPAIVANWFLEPVVDKLRSQRKLLSRGQCYGFTILPIFAEGSYAAENRFCLSATEHIAVSGHVHLQIQDVPDGGQVKITTTP